MIHPRPAWTWSLDFILSLVSALLAQAVALAGSGDNNDWMDYPKAPPARAPQMMAPFQMVFFSGEEKSACIFFEGSCCFCFLLTECLFSNLSCSECAQPMGDQTFTQTCSIQTTSFSTSVSGTAVCVHSMRCRTDSCIVGW